MGVISLSEGLKNTNQFKIVYNNGKSYANRELVMYLRKNDSDTNRLGISVSKKVGNSVVRHRITRLIRESYRLNEAKLLQGYDIVVVARANAKEKNYFDICRAFLHLAKLHRIIEEKQ
mgnify:FL=1